MARTAIVTGGSRGIGDAISMGRPVATGRLRPDEC